MRRVASLVGCLRPITASTTLSISRPLSATPVSSFSSSVSSTRKPITIGILNAAGPPAPQFAHLPVDLYKWFTDIFSAADPTLKFRHYKLQENQLPATLDECNHYLITGSSCSVYQQAAWLPPALDFIHRIINNPANTGPRAIGVCFGHQACNYVANRLTGVAKSPKGWGVGMKRFKINQRTVQPWMQPFQDSLLIGYTHQDQVEEVASHGTVLGSSQFVPNELTQIVNPVTKQPKVLSFQGHIEYPRWYFKALYESRVPLIDSTKSGRAAAAIQSLADTAYSDEVVLAKWCVNFLRYPSLPQAATSTSAASVSSSSSYATASVASPATTPIQARV